MVINIGDLIIDKEGAALVTNIDVNNYVKLEWNRQSHNVTTTHMSNVEYLVQLERWKIQRVKNDQI